MKITVTGAGGYLGARLVPVLLDAGHQVAAVDTFPFGEVLADVAGDPNLSVHRSDVRTLDPAILHGCDSVIALAAVSNDPAANLSQRWTTEVNQTATMRLAEQARGLGVSRFLHASTAAVYGVGGAEFDETDPLHPLSAYARSKADTEKTLADLDTDSFRVVSLRMATLYGLSPRMRRDLGVHAMALSALSTNEIRVDGSGQQWRPLLHVEDAAHAFLHCAEAESLPPAAVFNVVADNVRVVELATAIAEATGATIRTSEGPDDARSYRLNGARLAATGYAPVRSLPEGIAEIVDYFSDPDRRTAAAATHFSTADTLARLLKTPAIRGGHPVRTVPLPLAVPNLGDAEEHEVLDTMRSGWLSTGPKTQRFERMMADYLGVKNAVAVNSCTAALHLALLAAGIGPGDEVITTPVTWPATVNVIVHSGAKVVFADIDPDTLNIDPAAVAAAITNRTRAILPVHMAGQPCDLDAIGAVAANHGLTVIEDAAHALGAHYKDRMIGQISDAAAFSFYATKNITTGEGGMLVTDNDQLAATARALAAQGLSKDAWKRHSTSGSPHWLLESAGWKYAMSDIAAALGVVQLPRLEEFIAAREHLAAVYDVHLDGLDGLTPLRRLPDRRHAHHLYIVKLDTDQLTIGRDEFIAALRAEGICSGIHFPALHTQPYYQREYGLTPDALPVAHDVAARILSLPLHPGMSTEDAVDVAHALAKLVTAYHH
ncbi:aminotransferase class I/II-fold pyridoxal phosphate-dependent enzyme [Nocardia sp. NPDC004722]